MSDADDRRGRCPFDFGAIARSRRALLVGAGGASLTALLAGAAAAQRVPASATRDGAVAADDRAADHAHDAGPHDFENDGTADRQPFHGAHQAGVVNPQPAAAVLAAFDVLAGDRDELRRLFEALTRRIAGLMAGGIVPITDPRMPPPDNLLLGPVIAPDDLTVTVALGASLFDERFGLATAKPARLATMEQFPNDALEPAFCHGDLFLQFCSNTTETNIHALREIVRATSGLLAIRWKMDGFLPPHTRKKLGRDTIRNLMGFKDGTANLDAGDRGLMDRLVWVGTGAGEPPWTQGGSYVVVRLIRMLVERWDRTPLREQEEIIGRDKGRGAPLGLAEERDPPDYASAANAVRADAHIRLANPRTPGSEGSLILRRPYNFSRDAVMRSGQLDMGLAFICFQADLDAGFRAVQTRLNGEPLEEYVKPFGGGYFFVLPGVRDAGDYLGRTLLESRPA